MFDNFQGMLALPEDPNKNAAARQGLLAFGASLLGGQGDFGGILGNGLMAGSQTYNGALAQQQQAALRQAQMQQIEVENKQRQAAIDRPRLIAEALRGPAQAPQQQQAPAPVQQEFGGPRRGIPSFDSNLDGYTSRSLADLRRIGEPPRAASAPSAVESPNVSPTVNAPPDDYATLMRQSANLAAAGLWEEAKQAHDMAKASRPEVREVVEMQLGGKRVMVQLFKDGRPPQLLDGYSPKAEKLHFADTGGATVGLDSFTGNTVSTVANSVSPGEKLASETSRRGQDLQDRRSREANQINKQGQRSQVINDPTQGPIVVDKATGEARQVTLNGQAVPGEAVAKREASAKTLLPLIGQARKLIGGATGSYLGAAADEGARLFGVATNGAQNIAQLKVLEGNFMMAQPRMEGPQSNMDVALYRQMAAQIGDPTVPIPTKMAALNTLESLYAKYAPETQSPAGSGKPQIKPVKQILREQKSGIPAGWTVKEK